MCQKSNLVRVDKLSVKENGYTPRMAKIFNILSSCAMSITVLILSASHCFLFVSVTIYIVLDLLVFHLTLYITVAD